jgi:hypothetical protein
MFDHSGQQIVIVTDLKKLNEEVGKEQFRVEVSGRFVTLEDLDAGVEINSAWETIRI